MEQQHVLTELTGSILEITLNRPKALNSLTVEMVDAISQALEEAAKVDDIRLVLLRGAGDRGFCAGGDIKTLAAFAREGNFAAAERFFAREYALDLMLHRYPKPLVAVAHGITMGGGMGLAAGADIVIATESTVMAMPETRIGFFPDVGATGWLHEKCPPGYPEFLALSGHEVRAAETVRLGLAAHFVPEENIDNLLEQIRCESAGFTVGRSGILSKLRAVIRPFSGMIEEGGAAMDSMVKKIFTGRASLADIMAALEDNCSGIEPFEAACGTVPERSPTALALTLYLLRLNRGKKLEEVFANELAAASYIIRHHDYYEGIRARIIDRDDTPKWEPRELKEVRLDFTLE